MDISLNDKQFKKFTNYHTPINNLTNFEEETGLFPIETKVITRNDERYSDKYLGHTPQVLDIIRTFKVKDKQKFFLSLIKTGITYKII